MSGSQGIRFLCGMCSYSTEDDGAFLSHYTDQHKREMAYWCRECGHTFTSPTLLVGHIKSSCPRVKSVTMRCGVTNCSFAGNDPFQFMQHVKIVHKGVHLFPCFKCRKLFTIPSCLIQHIQTECAEIKRPSSGEEPPRSCSKPAAVVEGAKQHNSGKQSAANPTKVLPKSNVASVKTEKRLDDSWKKKTLFAGSDEDSDPDDPTWKPVPVDKTKKPYSCDLQSDIEILYSSADQTKKGHKLAKRKDSSEGSNVNAKKPKIKEEDPQRKGKKETGEQQQQRFERWSDWWKAVSSLKSATAMEKLQQEDSLCHFFTCMEHSCHFSTNNDLAFMKHQTREHPCKKLPCLYCLREFEAGVTLTEHTVVAHATRRQQCSRCPYRAATKGQVALHFEAMHGGKPVIYSCEPVGQDSTETEIVENAETEVAMPYICRVGQCKYETCNPEEFVVHNRSLHSGVSVYPCFYCGAETFKLDALMRHYRLHGIYNFQCAHCVHGTNTIEEILCHQCLNHAERRMQVYVRPSNKSESPRVETVPKVETEARDRAYPEFHPDYAGNFSCGVEKCLHTLDGLDSYKEHLLASHHCNSFFPCPHCTEISITSTSLEEHLSMHGPTLYSCSARDCSFLHWEKNVINAHCREKHFGILAGVVIVREVESKTEERKTGHVKSEGTEENRDNRINFQLQLLGSISLQSTVPQSLSLGESKCTFGGEIPEETSSSKPLKAAPSMQKRDHAGLEEVVNVKIEDFGNRMRVCCFCGFSTTLQDAFREHLYRELDYKPFYCGVCDFTHYSKSGVLQHIENHHPAAAAEIACKKRQNDIFDSWVSSYVDRGPADLCLKDLACVVCGMAVSSIKNHRQHLCDHLQYRPHACITCKETFYSPEEASAHTLARHDTVRDFTSAPIERIEEWLRERTRKSSAQKDRPFGKADDSKGRGCFRNYYKCYYCDFGPSILTVQIEHCSVKHVGRKLRLKNVETKSSSKPFPPSPEKLQYSVPRAFLCPHCGQSRPSKKSLDFHKTICKGSTLRPNGEIESETSSHGTPKAALSQRSEYGESGPGFGRLSEESHSRNTLEGFSFYKKKSRPFNLSKICIVPPQSSSVKIPVEDYMKILNFNMCLNVVDLRKTFSS